MTTVLSSYLLRNFETLANELQVIGEGIIALVNANKIALVFKTDETIFNYINKADSTHLATTYIRYLIDICETIYIVSDQTFQLNPDSTNPFIENISPFFKF
jgi:hypothetical protein